MARKESAAAPRSDAALRCRWSVGGGTNGKGQLTSIIGTALIILLAVIGLTILRIGQLMWVHLFVGPILIGPVVLKMASTG